MRQSVEKQSSPSAASASHLPAYLVEKQHRVKEFRETTYNAVDNSMDVGVKKTKAFVTHLRVCTDLVEGSVLALGVPTAHNVISRLDEVREGLEGIQNAWRQLTAARREENRLHDELYDASCGSYATMKEKNDQLERELRTINIDRDRKDAALDNAIQYVHAVIAERAAWQEQHGYNRQELPVEEMTFSQRCTATLSSLYAARRAQQPLNTSSLMDLSGGAGSGPGFLSDRPSIQLHVVPDRSGAGSEGVEASAGGGGILMTSPPSMPLGSGDHNNNHHLHHPSITTVKDDRGSAGGGFMGTSSTTPPIGSSMASGLEASGVRPLPNGMTSNTVLHSTIGIMQASIILPSSASLLPPGADQQKIPVGRPYLSLSDSPGTVSKRWGRLQDMRQSAVSQSCRLKYIPPADEVNLLRDVLAMGTGSTTLMKDIEDERARLALTQEKVRQECGRMLESLKLVKRDLYLMKWFLRETIEKRSPFVCYQREVLKLLTDHVESQARSLAKQWMLEREKERQSDAQRKKQKKAATAAAMAQVMGGSTSNGNLVMSGPHSGINSPLEEGENLELPELLRREPTREGVSPPGTTAQQQRQRQQRRRHQQRATDHQYEEDNPNNDDNNESSSRRRQSRKRQASSTRENVDSSDESRFQQLSGEQFLLPNSGGGPGGNSSRRSTSKSSSSNGNYHNNNNNNNNNPQNPHGESNPMHNDNQSEGSSERRRFRRKVSRRGGGSGGGGLPEENESVSPPFSGGGNPQQRRSILKGTSTNNHNSPKQSPLTPQPPSDGTPSRMKKRGRDQEDDG